MQLFMAILYSQEENLASWRKRRMFLKAKLEDPNSSSQFMVEIIWSSSADDMPVA